MHKKVESRKFLFEIADEVKERNSNFVLYV